VHRLWALRYTAPSGTRRNYKIAFSRNGTFSYDETRDDPGSPETWQLTGSHLKMCINECFSTYEGTWKGDRFEGRATSAQGSWTFTLTPKR
jgi:hypothetical protein